MSFTAGVAEPYSRLKKSHLNPVNDLAVELSEQLQRGEEGRGGLVYSLLQSYSRWFLQVHGVCQTSNRNPVCRNIILQPLHSQVSSCFVTATAAIQ